MAAVELAARGKEDTCSAPCGIVHAERVFHAPVLFKGTALYRPPDQALPICFVPGQILYEAPGDIINGLQIRVPSLNWGKSAYNTL